MLTTVLLLIGLMEYSNNIPTKSIINLLSIHSITNISISYDGENPVITLIT